MNLTFALPALNRQSDEQPPTLKLPTFNEMLRYGKFQSQATPTSAFYAQYLWQGSLLQRIKKQLNIPAQQAVAFASPVWQQMGMHQVSVIHGEYIQIQAAEAQQLCQQLSDFYKDEHWHFQVIQPHLWLLSMPSETDWQIESVLDICGQTGSSTQAQGKDALQWLAKQTEIQMWLHSHPLNAQRTQHKQPTINGLWLWQDLVGTSLENAVLHSNSPWQRFYHGKTVQAENFAQYLTLTTQNPKNSEGLIFLDDLLVTQQTGDVWAYQNILQYWEQHWFAPAWQALHQGKLQSLKITTDGEQGGTLTLTPKSKWAFWKQAREFKGIW